MRIISGFHKGRKIKAPVSINVRPTTDKAKESLFNILNNRYTWSRIKVLDLFSGTGNISYEFGSRGVQEIVSVDKSKRCIDFIKKTAIDLNLPIVTKNIEVIEYLSQNLEIYDIIFMDPPYFFDKKDYRNIIKKIYDNEMLAKGLIIIEHSSKIDLSEFENFTEKRTYGNNCFSFLMNKKAGL
tara:strand:+ start:16998 stop:17546 length:549 start_codon:yes stop_codon:yes gene_type:complete